MRAIVGAIRAGALDADARIVVSNKAEAPALEFAKSNEIQCLRISTLREPMKADVALAAALLGAGIDLVILSGYLRRLGPITLEAYEGRILNIHPGPLPTFGGEGMYGRRVHEAVIASGVAETEICVHVVDEDYDHGPVIARRSLPVVPGETAEDLERRVTAAEPALFVETLREIAAGRLVLPSPAARATSPP